MRLFSDELLAWRRFHELLQKEAADVLACPLTTYRKWENGKRTPKILTLEGLRQRMKSYTHSKSQ